MSQNTKPPSRLSFAGRHPDLHSGTPISLRDVQPVELFFNDAVNPLRVKERKAMALSEKERREGVGEGTGSMMVKLHKPFPELKPVHAHNQVRKSFNDAWLKEKQRAVMQRFEQQKETQNQSDTPSEGIQPMGYDGL